MADNSDPTNASDESSPTPEVEAVELTPDEGKAGVSSRPVVFIVMAFIVLVAGVVALARNVGGGDDVIDVPVGDETDVSAGDDVAAPDEDPEEPMTSGGDSGEDDGDSRDSGDGIAFGGDASASAFGFGGGGEWLVPWGDGFLTFGLVYAPTPLPVLDGRFDHLFPPEVRETLEAVGATTIDEATDALTEAGLYDIVVEIVIENPEVQEWLFAAEPPPPTLEVMQSSDGLTWEVIDGVSIPGGENISSVISDGEHLVVASQTYEFVDEFGPGTTMMQVAITTDLTTWEVHDIPGVDPDSVPEHVFVERGIGGVAIGPEGWLVSTNSYAWIDEWSLLPEDIRPEYGGWEIRADESGLTIDIYEAFEPEFVDDESGEIYEERDCCDVVESRVLEWDELGIDYATWQQYRESENSTASTWTAAWGADPVETVIPGSGGFGSVVGTDAGYVAVTWSDETRGNRILFSTDGRSWVERSSPSTNGNGWIDQVVSVEGGILAAGSDGFGQLVWRADSDGSNWREIEVPGLGPNNWFGLYSSSALPGLASIVDLQDYSDFEDNYEGFEDVYLEIDLDGFFIFIQEYPDGRSSVAIDDYENGVAIFAESDVSYPDDIPEYMSLDEASGEVAFIDPETGDEVVRMSIDDFLAAYEARQNRSNDVVDVTDADDVAVEAVDGPFPEPDFWLLATTDGTNWLLEDLDEGGDMEPYPQQAAINGDVVIARIGDNWTRYTLG